MGASETLRTRLLSSQRTFNKYIFYDQNNFLQNEYIFKKDLYFICNTNIFCIKIYFSIEIYILTFSFIFFSVKKVFFSKKNFQCKTFFFPYKNILSANFVKNIFFQKKIFFFNLVLQQMNNHSWTHFRKFKYKKNI